MSTEPIFRMIKLEMPIFLILILFATTHHYPVSSSVVDTAIGYSKINLTYNSDLNLTCAQSQSSKNVKFYQTNMFTNETTLISYDKHKYIFNPDKSILTIKKLSMKMTRLLIIDLVIVSNKYFF